ncbi:MAG: DUF2851 family protein [Bacteroidetes bacterium]|nr:DUF2851 family protein [Bacteroidota bacterium]
MKRHAWNIHERFLRHIWSRQYLRIPLQTADGKSLSIIDVGRLNSDSGPDFLNAKMKIGNITYAGDVEIHRTVFDWFQHRHQQDPRYNGVILHVVLEPKYKLPPTLVKSGREIPVLVLGNFLSESIHTIWQKAILDERIKKSEAIKCFDRNEIIPVGLIESWLKKLAVERLEIKLRRFEERIKQLAYEKRMMLHEFQGRYGKLPLEGEHNEIPSPFPELAQKDYAQKELWDQILYEGFMEGLGYSKNSGTFVRLARTVTLKAIRNLEAEKNEFKIQALLFGTAGLIPKVKSIKEKLSREYVRKLSREWKTLKPLLNSEILNPADWQFFPTRPHNFPTIRIAAASIIIRKILFEDIFRNIIQVIKTSDSEKKKGGELIRLFSIETNDFWNNRYDFGKIETKKITALGLSRTREIIINTVFPVALLYTRIFKDLSIRECALKIYSAFPAAENNAIIRLMDRQLLKGRYLMQGVSCQQGLIQLYKYYCTEGRCSECEFGRTLFK